MFTAIPFLWQCRRKESLAGLSLSHRLCLPQQMWDPEDALPWHLLLQPEKSRTQLLQCLPWRFPACWAVLGRAVGLGCNWSSSACSGMSRSAAGDTGSHRNPVRSRGGWFG